MTHRGRVVEVGGADTAFLNWIARRHGGTDSDAKEAPARAEAGAAAKIAGKKPAAAKKKPAKKTAAAKKKPAKKTAGAGKTSRAPGSRKR
jgi:hypothetical protein